MSLPMHLEQWIRSSQLYDHRKGVVGNQARRESETDAVDAASLRVQPGDQRQERCGEHCSSPLDLT
ncbi:hypothetical protein CR513_52109, partial [Mucuna pruriens]